MKLFLCLLLLTSCGYAQIPAHSIRRDTLPGESTRDLMPNAQPGNSFYRYHSDPPNVVRATLDNMPIKVPDSSVHYTMLRSFRKYGKQEEPSLPFLKPMRPLLPKKKF